MLNKYLQKQAMQQVKSDVSRTLVISDDQGNIPAYYSLNMGSIDKNQLPEKLQKRFPYHPLPIVRLARLAVDLKQQGQGTGKQLLTHALHECYQLSQEIGMIAVVIDAKNTKAKQLYLQFEFDNLPDKELTLWLPITALRRLFDK